MPPVTALLRGADEVGTTPDGLLPHRLPAAARPAGVDLVNTDLMRRRALGPAVDGFLDTIRDGHPTVPLLVVSPLLRPIHEEIPRPRGRCWPRSSPALCGRPAPGLPRRRELYGEADVAAYPLPDELHPDAATHRLIGERFHRLDRRFLSHAGSDDRRFTR